METVNTVKPGVSGWIIALRVLIFILTPVLLLMLLAFVGSSIAATNVVYMRSEPMLFAYIPLVIVSWIALGIRWSGAKKLARKVIIISTVVVVGFLGLTTTLETVNTKPIVDADKSFHAPSEYRQVLEGNNEKFSPAPSGLVPCFDIMGEGCPHIAHTWTFNPQTPPTEKDLRKILDDTGWENVEIQHNHLFAASESHPHDSVAEGKVNGYKATVRFVESANGSYELRMYLRPSNNPR